MSYYESNSGQSAYPYDPYEDNSWCDEPVPNYGIPAPIPEQTGHRTRNRVIAGVAALATVAGLAAGVLAPFVSSGDAHKGGKTPAAVGKSHPGREPVVAANPNYNPAACVTQTAGEIALDLTCAEDGFGDGLTPAVSRDLGAVVTVNVASPIHYTAAEKQKMIREIIAEGGTARDWQAGYWSTDLTGERVQYDGGVKTVTAGHANEKLGAGACLGGGDSTVAADGSLTHQGFAVNMTGLQTAYTNEKTESLGDTDFGVVTTNGANEGAYDDLPAIPTEVNARPKAGELFEALTEEPTYGTAQDQEPNSPTPADRQTRAIKLVYVGQDPMDSQDGVFIPLGPVKGDQGYAIGGASGSAIVSEENGVEEAMLVRGLTTGELGNENPQTLSGAEFADEYGVTPTNNGHPVNVQPIIGQFIPGQYDTPTITCG